VRATEDGSTFARLRGFALGSGKVTVGILQGPQTAMALDFVGSSVRLSGFADPASVDLELASPTMLGGFLIAERVRVVRASAAGLEVEPEPGPSVELLRGGLGRHVSCADLTLARRGERARHAGLAARTKEGWIGADAVVELRAAPDGSAVARVHGPRRADVLESGKDRVRVEIESESGALIGWIDARELGRAPADAGAPPRGAPPAGAAAVETIVCDADVQVFAGTTPLGAVVAGARIPVRSRGERITTIGAPEWDDPLSFWMAEIDLEEGADLAVESAAIAACHR
jgi:hypothetical protein